MGCSVVKYRASQLRNILNFIGILPVWETKFGMVEGASDAKRRKWISVMHALVKRAS